MDNRARRTGLETCIYGIECRFRVKYVVTSCYSGLSGVKVASLGIHQFKTDRTIRKESLRTVSVWHQRYNITRVAIYHNQFRDTSGVGGPAVPPRPDVPPGHVVLGQAVPPDT